MLSLTETYRSFFSGIYQIEEAVGHIAENPNEPKYQVVVKQLEKRVAQLQSVPAAGELILMKRLETEYLYQHVKNNAREISNQLKG